MNSENSDFDIIRLANNFITKNPYSDGTEFFKFLLPKTGKIAFRFVKKMKKLNIHEREWEYCGSKVYPDQDRKDNDCLQVQTRMPDELGNSTEIIFAEEIEHKIPNYVFNEEIMAKIDGFITNNEAAIMIGGRRYSGKSAFIGFVAKKYHFNLVKFDWQYFRNFHLKNFFHKLNEFVQKNGKSLFHIDNGHIPNCIFIAILLATNPDYPIYGSFILFEACGVNQGNVFIPEFTTVELLSHFQNCLRNRTVLQDRFTVDQRQIQRYFSSIHHWTHLHFTMCQSFQQGYSLLTEENFIHLISSVNTAMKAAEELRKSKINE